jgi:TolB protein
VASAQSLRDGPHALIVGIDVASGATTRLEGRWNNVLDLEWVPGSESFIAAAVEVGHAAPQLWQIRFPSGERHRITNDLNSYSSLSLSSDRSSLATVQTEVVSNLWVSNMSDPGGGVAITRGRGRSDGQTGLDWTPDGRIAFVSGASGTPQIWITDPEGRDIRQLTAGPQEPVFRLSVTPDGRYVVFQRLADRRMRIWRMNLDGSDQRMLTDGDLDQMPVAAPGGLVYFFRVNGGVTHPFKVSIDGGDAVQISEQYFRPIDVSQDGSELLGVGWDAEARRSALALMPAAGGPARILTPVAAFSGGFTADGTGLIYPVIEKGTMRLDRFDLTSEKIVTLGSVPDVIFNAAVSPDGKRLALSRGGVLSDVLLLGMRQ